MSNTTFGRSRFIVDCIYYTLSIAFFLFIFYYYWTGIGGPTLLAMTMIPIVFRSLHACNRCARTISIQVCRQSPIT